MINKLFYAAALIGSEWILIILIILSITSIALILKTYFTLFKIGKWEET